MPDNRLIFVYPQGGAHLERVRDGMLAEVMCYSNDESFRADVVGRVEGRS
jgi:hypothetical protein